MIPFDRIYSWLFKSFNISGETVLVERLIADEYQRLLIIKRSWIFAVFTLWLPICILILSGISIFIAYSSIDIPAVKYTLIAGNLIMSVILIISSVNYIRYFRSIHHETEIVTDMHVVRDELALWDSYFVSFFNWSITNQWILILIIIIEVTLVLLYNTQIGGHFWILATDTFVILIEIALLRHYRKRMMDLEMDYNIIVEGKIFFVNQSGLLSTVQIIEWNQIKTIQSVFPSKIASFFNYGTINILTEWDTALIGTMSMHYVTDPDRIVTYIQILIDAKIDRVVPVIDESLPASQKPAPILIVPAIKKDGSSKHTVDTREQVRDIMR